MTRPLVMRMITIPLVAVSVLSGSCLTASAATFGKPSSNKAEPVQYQSMLRHANLQIDDFSQKPQSLWSIHVEGSTIKPTLKFTDSTPGPAMVLSWAGEPSGTIISDVRSIKNQDWSGYSQLEVTISNESLHNNVWVMLSNDNGEVYKVPLNGSGAVVTPASDGWSTVDISLAGLNPQHPPHRAPDLHGLPALASLTSLAFRVNVTSTTSDGNLEVRDVRLIKSSGFDGPSAYLDTSFYNGQNWMDIAKQVHDQGFTAVHLIVLNLDEDQTIPVQAFHAYNIPVALSIYPTTNSQAYDEHPSWRQLSLGGLGQFDWRVYLSPSNPEFVSWLDSQVADEFSKYQYDGLELTEPWLEVWGGPYKDNPDHKYYMDISQNATNSFERQYGYDPLKSLFLRDSDGVYYLNPQMENSTQYQEWQTFRVNTMNSFLESLTTSARRTRPGITTFVTYLADVRVNGGQSYNKVREYQAQDLEGIEKTVKPDYIILQSPWQDWTESNLLPSYIQDYANAYLSRVRPNIKAIVQTDVGSVVKRDFQWLKQFSTTSEKAGFDGYQIYEWSVAGWNVKPTTLLLGDFTDGTSDGWLPYGSNMTCNVTFPVDKSLGHPVAHVDVGTQSSNAWALFERYGLNTHDWSTQGVNGVSMQLQGDGSEQSVKFVVQDNGGKQWVSYIPLDDVSWHRVQLPFSSFQPYAGGASGAIDVDSIERVKFVVEGAPLSSSLSFSVYDIQGTK